MATGDQWVKGDRYHVRLHRDGQKTGITICAVKVLGVLQYELWDGVSMVDRNESPEPLKQQARRIN